ncbi:uncharacterized protein BT62DRAFT_1000820 [Guyanagaster necrorhizus]|uniref:Uncharacterized protein n=1 Tax=Guyanagaster necrorhizus TaxID=856835 RepID=A0A9P8AXF6_9AGAR|nr:uncharacterized protein BT62DRAFT_1000820 [Guyanagaster necrorhizus MCA 3950]KAG7451563.1 hypothetical protein BT62DRAFT_1000820 [Guyanagaster necrorhizus MCA 3950]
MTLHRRSLQFAKKLGRTDPLETGVVVSTINRSGVGLVTTTVPALMLHSHSSSTPSSLSPPSANTQLPTPPPEATTEEMNPMKPMSLARTPEGKGDDAWNWPPSRELSSVVLSWFRSLQARLPISFRFFKSFNNVDHVMAAPCGKNRLSYTPAYLHEQPTSAVDESLPKGAHLSLSPRFLAPPQQQQESESESESEGDKPVIGVVVEKRPTFLKKLKAKLLRRMRSTDPLSAAPGCNGISAAAGRGAAHQCGRYYRDCVYRESACSTLSVELKAWVCMGADLGLVTQGGFGVVQPFPFERSSQVGC